MKTWKGSYYGISNKKWECPQKRSIYDLALKPNVYVPHSATGSVLKIQLKSSNVYTIKDSIAYDLQSLIGEVGGTLGLFLGLSTMSFIDFIEFIFRKLFS